jgi:hypothetical protein
LGEEASEAIWRFIIAEVKALAFKNAGIPISKRGPLYLIVDEADTFISSSKSISTILKETRKYGLSITLITQTLIGGKGNDQLRRHILSNTNIKDIGANSITTLKPLSHESWVSLKMLQWLAYHEFYVRYGAHWSKSIKTSNIFHKRSPLLQSKWSVLSQTHRMIKETPYYKPKLPHQIEPEEWMNEIPIDRHDHVKSDHYPSPKYRF